MFEIIGATAGGVIGAFIGALVGSLFYHFWMDFHPASTFTTEDETCTQPYRRGQA